jgi:hypothetical protein
VVVFGRNMDKIVNTKGVVAKILAVLSCRVAG